MSVAVSLDVAAGVEFNPDNLFQLKKQLAKTIFDTPQVPFTDYTVIKNLEVTSVPVVGGRRMQSAVGNTDEEEEFSQEKEQGKEVGETEEGEAEENEGRALPVILRKATTNTSYVWQTSFQVATNDFSLANSSTNLASKAESRLQEHLLERLNPAKGFYQVPQGQGNLGVSSWPTTRRPTSAPTSSPTMRPTPAAVVPAPTTSLGTASSGSQSSASASGLLIGVIVGAVALIVMAACWQHVSFQETAEQGKANNKGKKGGNSSNEELFMDVEVGGGDGTKMVPVSSTAKEIAEQHSGHVEATEAQKLELAEFLETTAELQGVTGVLANGELQDLTELLHEFGTESMRDLLDDHLVNAASLEHDMGLTSDEAAKVVEVLAAETYRRRQCTLQAEVMQQANAPSNQNKPPQAERSEVPTLSTTDKVLNPMLPSEEPRGNYLSPEMQSPASAAQATKKNSATEEGPIGSL
jgi:hypothetical protein